jgi:hypothetical protein
MMNIKISHISQKSKEQPPKAGWRNEHNHTQTCMRASAKTQTNAYLTLSFWQFVTI